MGPSGPCREVVRDYLAGHGYEQGPKESLAETMARALAISILELKALMQNGRLGSELLNRLREAR